MKTSSQPPNRPHGHAARQRGASLIVVMLILIVVSAIGIGASQIAMMGERSARNDRDIQVAWQAAEAALMDAEFDIRGPNTSTEKRVDLAFGGAEFRNAKPVEGMFATTGCGTSNTLKTRGLCQFVDEALGATQKQTWLVANFENDGTNAEAVAYGEFTDRTYSAGGTGVRSSKAPRYIIEPIRDYAGSEKGRDKSETKAAFYMYRVTAMGFGPRDDIQAVAQMILRP